MAITINGDPNTLLGAFLGFPGVNVNSLLGGVLGNTPPQVNIPGNMPDGRPVGQPYNSGASPFGNRSPGQAYTSYLPSQLMARMMAGSGTGQIPPQLLARMMAGSGPGSGILSSVPSLPQALPPINSNATGMGGLLGSGLLGFRG